MYTAIGTELDLVGGSIQVYLAGHRWDEKQSFGAVPLDDYHVFNRFHLGSLKSISIYIIRTEKQIIEIVRLFELNLFFSANNRNKNYYKIRGIFIDVIYL